MHKKPHFGRRIVFIEALVSIFNSLNLKSKKMKTKATLLIGASVIALFSCEQSKYQETDRVAATTNLEKYVDSVDMAVKARPVHDWSMIDSRYNGLESRADEVYKDLKYEEDGLEVIENRYETIVSTGKREQKNFEETAEMHMTNVENWSKMKSENMKKGVKNAANDVENAAKESMNWLESNMDKLDNDRKDNYARIKIDLDKN